MPLISSRICDIMEITFRKNTGGGKNMTNKKMWQAFAVICLFSVFSALIAFLTQSVFPDTAQSRFYWWIPFGIGIVFMIVSIVLSLLREKLPRKAWLCMFFNALSCSLLIGSYLIGSGAALPWFRLLAVALAPALFYLLLMALLSVPVLNQKVWYNALCLAIWAIALFASALAVWMTSSLKDNYWDDYVVLSLFSVVTMGLAVGSLLPAESFRQLLYEMITPCTVCLGAVAIIVLLALVGGDDCSCDCDGGCCDCSPAYGGSKRKKKTMNMSDLSSGIH